MEVRWSDKMTRDCLLLLFPTGNARGWYSSTTLLLPHDHGCMHSGLPLGVDPFSSLTHSLSHSPSLSLSLSLLSRFV
jgi:hypothetical protein